MQRTCGHYIDISLENNDRAWYCICVVRHPRPGTAGYWTQWPEVTLTCLLADYVLRLLHLCICKLEAITLLLHLVSYLQELRVSRISKKMQDETAAKKAQVHELINIYKF